MSGWKQFSELFKRNIQYLLRNEATMRVTFFNGAFIALMLLSLYFRMSDVDIEDNVQQSRLSITNWLGLSFNITTDMSMFSSLMVVLQVTM